MALLSVVGPGLPGLQHQTQGSGKRTTIQPATIAHSGHVTDAYTISNRLFLWLTQPCDVLQLSQLCSALHCLYMGQIAVANASRHSIMHVCYQPLLGKHGAKTLACEGHPPCLVAPMLPPGAAHTAAALFPCPAAVLAPIAASGLPAGPHAAGRTRRRAAHKCAE
jgi:hypothetical protein